MKIQEGFEAAGRHTLTQTQHADLVITGGGLSGVCAAITAARQGLKVVLIQDRPVLGGNASSEVRLWVLGATSHMGNNNRWSREGGVIDEILVENVYRNPEGNPIIFDLILLDKVSQEANIMLLLNTVVYEADKDKPDHIRSLKAFCSQNSTTYHLHAPLFCDASGDGIVGFMAGAAFRMGAEKKEEFDEPMAPEEGYGELLGHSLYFYSKDTTEPVKFVAPSFALDVQKNIPRFRNFKASEYGCQLWWVEHGGRLDTIHDTERIKWELWQIVYGIWDYIKNSGNFPEAENKTLEWVGMIPGKRESRRFEGDYMLSQRDLIEQRSHEDAVGYGGWSIDLHPADGVFSERSPCNQWHSKGIFDIPFRCLYSRNIGNLLLAGRIISSSHVAFGATRVMATAAYTGQAVAMAAAVCKATGSLPKELLAKGHIPVLQQKLLRTGHYIPGQHLKAAGDLVLQAELQASSTLEFNGFNRQEMRFKTLDISAAQLLPMQQGPCPVVTITIEASEATQLEAELRSSSRKGSFTPDTTYARKSYAVPAGRSELAIDFDLSLTEDEYVFFTLLKNPKIQLAYSKQRISGLLSVFNGENKKVSNTGKQVPPEGMGVDTFEFWCPQRRPEGHNFALTLSAPLQAFSVGNLRNGIDRPVRSTNAWVASPDDPLPHVRLHWPAVQSIQTVELLFDNDTDHAMESVLMTHPERVMPFCVQKYRIEDGEGRVLYEETANHQTLNIINFGRVVQTDTLVIFLEHPSEDVPASLFAVRCYTNQA